MALYFKKGVDISGITERGIILIYNMAYAYECHGYDCTVTSVKDGKHMKGSKHGEGNGVDFRTWPVRTRTDLLEIIETARHRLGKDFDVVLEKTHIHGEFDKK